MDKVRYNAFIDQISEMKNGKKNEKCTRFICEILGLKFLTNQFLFDRLFL